MHMEIDEITKELEEQLILKNKKKTVISATTAPQTILMAHLIQTPVIFFL